MATGQVVSELHAAYAPTEINKKLQQEASVAIDDYKKQAHLKTGAGGVSVYYVSANPQEGGLSVENYWHVPAPISNADFKATFGDAKKRMTSSISINKVDAQDTIRVSVEIIRQDKQGDLSNRNFCETRVHSSSAPIVIGGISDGNSGETIVVLEYPTKKWPDE
jgi:hypothetical protein